MNKNFLPSKQFVSRVISLVIIAIVIFGGYKLFGIISNKIKDRSNKEVAVTIKKSVQKDSNDNDIPDWEESLWGLNPRKNGEENKEFILAKRKLMIQNISKESNESISENDELTKAFFSVIMSLQQTGDLDETAVNAISDTYSEKIEATPIEDSYILKDLNIVPDTEENTTKYYTDMQNTINKYKESGIGEELGLIVQAIAYNDPQVLYAVQTIALSYRDFGQDLRKIQVPSFLSEIHLSLINNCEKNAVSLHDMTMLFDDPMIAMKGIINYKKYNEILSINLGSLSYIFGTE
ncbi:TPA: hypothetical protein DIC38_00845 [Candidatus Nomurabacteria bacterium]|nr:MAG: hypothetical protein O210_OD1C00001G0559 [Parcubacteria bacterium RAAC4_OD1_1]HCY26219.1 hypothetical protein [Candidatus Nomurabacteria bacterium]